MNISKRGVEFIAQEEGVVTRAYRDVAGVWTIGVGHTAAAGPPTPRPGMTITRAEALDILERDLPKYEAPVDRLLPNVPQYVHDGATSFCFNVGQGAFSGASWVQKYRAGDMAGAEASLKSWNKATVNGRKVVVAGLVNRRRREADLIFRGIYPGNLGTEPAAPTTSEAVLAYQRQLETLGYDPGPLDGIRGPRTIAAVRAFQADHGLVVDGLVGPATRAVLERETTPPPVVPPAPPPAGPPAPPQPSGGVLQRLWAALRSLFT